jgi:hypothetical protein
MAGNQSKRSGRQSSTNSSSLQAASEEQVVPRVVITGDDILIEYVRRVAAALKPLSDTSLPADVFAQLSKFITHHFWHFPDQVEKPESCMHTRLSLRLSEMQDRHRRLLRHTYKKDNKLE